MQSYFKNVWVKTASRQYLAFSHSEVKLFFASVRHNLIVLYVHLINCMLKLTSQVT